jgi:VWFA-related protein
MRPLVPFAVCVLASAGLSLHAQQPPPVQTPPPQQQQPPPAQPPGQQQQPPVFTTGVDVIRLDVSVLDNKRRPVRGLTKDDFTVFEDGKKQTVVAISEIVAALQDPMPSAWMRFVPHDIAMNDLADQAGDGRVFAILMDDWNIPFDDLDIIMQARIVARGVVDRLGPSDIAAVIFPTQAGKTQDFTGDRRRLIEAIDKFDPPEVRFVPATPAGTSGGGADMPYRSSSALMRSQCQRSQPTIPTLDALATRMAAIPNRRKTIILVSVGAPVELSASRGCEGELAETTRDMFRKAQRANINIYSVDPAGYKGYEDYLQRPIRRGGRPAEYTLPAGPAHAAAKQRRDFLEIMANDTGARAIVNTPALEIEVDRMFEEAAAYYLVGYQTSNGRPDGKYRKVEVKVRQPDVTVRTRSGFYAPKEDTRATTDQRGGPDAVLLGPTGMMMPASLALRATAVAIARPSEKARDADVAVVLSVRLPAPRGPVSETLSIVRTIYDAEGRASQPVADKIKIDLLPTSGDDFRYEVYQHLNLLPGRYQIRLNATSALVQRSGSVYVDVDVPDFSRPSLTMSGYVLGTRAVDRTDPLIKVVPILPTSARQFEPNEPVVAYLRVFQGGTGSPLPVTMTAKVLDVNDAVLLDTSVPLPATAFDGTRSAPFEIELPLSKLTHGPYLISVTAALQGGGTVRRDLVFRVR